ncbi:hypothetical protein MIR68_004577 [Amoeboaphelidium protococcarum]|nr:hypothetical protein MIR68_004577 [Amoeboaphelidium protococcarum]
MLSRQQVYEPQAGCKVVHFDEEGSCFIQVFNLDKVLVSQVVEDHQPLQQQSQEQQQQQQKQRESEFTIKDAMTVTYMRVSQDLNKLALLRDSQRIEIAVREVGIMSHTPAFSKKNVMIEILGFHWLHPACLLVISNCGIEYVEIAENQNKALKSVPSDVSWHHYVPGLLLTIGHGNAVSLFTINATDGLVEQWSKIVINTQQKLSPVNTKLFYCYSRSFLMIIKDQSAQVYYIDTTNAVLVFLSNVDVQALQYENFVINSYENMLVLSSIENNKSLVFDIAISWSVLFEQKFNCDSQLKWFAYQQYMYNNMSQIFRLQLDTSQVDSVLKNDTLQLQFLIRRSHLVQSTSISTKLLKMCSDDSLGNVNLVLQLLRHELDGVNIIEQMKIQHQVVPNLVKPTRIQIPRYKIIHNTENGQQRIKLTEKQLYETVWSVFMSRCKQLDRLVDVAVEFLLITKDKLVMQQLQTDLVKLLIKMENVHLLQSLINDRVIGDSIEVAHLLIRHPRLRGYGIEMYKRLKMYDLVVQLLLDNCEVVEAVKAVKQYGLMQNIAPANFLNAAVKVKDNYLTFYNVYAFLQQRNLYLYNSMNFRPQEECDDYIALFRSRFD